MSNNRFLKVAALSLMSVSLAGGVGAQSYIANPTKEDFISAFPQGDTAPGGHAVDGAGIRQKGGTRGLTVNMGPASVAPSVSASPRASTQRPAAQGMAAQRPASVNFPVQFAFGSADLSPEAKRVLDQLGAALNSGELSAGKFRIVGHTDAVGSVEDNLVLSEQRALAVQRYLTEAHGISAARLEARGVGKSEPMTPENPYAAVNRRVELIQAGRIDG